MKNTFGNNLQVTLFGESHGEAIGIVIDGLSAGIPLQLDFIQQQLEKRKAKGRISTQRREADEIHIMSGFFNGYTTGSPLCIMIQNTNTRSKDYSNLKTRLRPSHADYTAEVKYEGYQDYRGGGHFSGRLTAPLVAAGAIALQILNNKGIQIASHIKTLHHIEDFAFASTETALSSQITQLQNKPFPVIDEEKGKEMIAYIEKTASEGDSVGGIIESCIYHFPAGLGEPFFDSIESKLSHALFAIPAVKGVSFGSGFQFATMHGSEANDPLYYDDGVKTRTNHNGGINGGISNGMPIMINTVIKPTPSIYKEQETIDAKTKETTMLKIEGRHDPAIIHRACVVVDSMLALAILDLYLEHNATKTMK